MIKNLKKGYILDSRYEIKYKFGGDEKDDFGEGKSGFGEVYICKSLITGCTIALKTFQNKFIDNDKYIRLFEKEAVEWIKLIEHPNIVQASGFERMEYRYFIFLEPIIPSNGKKSLEDYLNDNILETELIDWGIQICYGMEYANSQGIIAHRDLKPANIMITEDKIIKITDFGLVKVKSDIAKDKFKINFTGSEYYSAPECYKGKYSIQSDIYSVGRILYKFAKKNSFINNPEENLDLNNSSENNLSNIIKKCTEKNPSNRYSSFKNLRKDLEEIYALKTGLKPYTPQLRDLKKQKFWIDGEKYNNLSYLHKPQKKEYLEKSVHNFKIAIKNDPNNPITLNNLACSLIKLGKNLEAEEYLLKSLKIKPDYPESNYNLGKIYANYYLFNNEEYYLNKSIYFNKKAIKYAEDIGFEYIDAYINLSFVNNLCQNYKETIKNLKKVIKIKPNCILAHIGLGEAYCNENDYDNAINIFKDFEKVIQNHEAIASKKDISGFYNQWGITYSTFNKENLAILKYDKSISIYYNNLNPHLNKVFSLINLKKLDKVADSYKRLIKEFPNDDRAKLFLGKFYLDQGELNNALKTFNELIESDSRLTVNSLCFKRDTLIKMQKDNLIDDAKEEYHIKLEKKEDIINLYHLSMILIEEDKLDDFNEDKLDKAIEYLDKAIKLTPKNELETIHQNLARKEISKYMA